jgi:hypothetical protein
MTTKVRDVATIVGRHRQDAVEDGRTCRACGRPWPCDVRLIAVALAVGEMRQVARSGNVAGALTSAARPMAPKSASRSRTRRASEAKPVPA